MQPEKSKRQLERERLKARLESGRMSREEYEARLKRMAHSSSNGDRSQARQRARLAHKLLSSGRMTQEQWREALRAVREECAAKGWPEIVEAREGYVLP